MPKIYVNQSITKTGEGEFTADCRCYDEGLRELFAFERDFSHATLTYAGYNTLFQALDRAWQTNGARGVEVRLKSNCRPLVADIERRRLDGTLGRILAGKLERYGMTINAEQL